MLTTGIDSQYSNEVSSTSKRFEISPVVVSTALVVPSSIDTCLTPNVSTMFSKISAIALFN